jgi:hypothetical protein
VQVIGDGDSEGLGKRQRTASVFERIEIPNEVQDGNQNSSVFSRLEEPMGAENSVRVTSVFNRLENSLAVPETQGRRSQ